MSGTLSAPLLSASWQPGRLLAALNGQWRFTRTLHSTNDHSLLGAIEGIACFSADGTAQARYEEEGKLALHNGQTVRSAARYYFREQDDGLVIYFDAHYRRLFHTLHLQGCADLQADSTHLCAADRYQSRYIFCRDGSFLITHTVTGPRKAYRSHTRYCR